LDGRVIRTGRAKQPSPQVIVNMFARCHQQIRFDGCSNHSGRRTFITNAARGFRSWQDRCMTCRCSLVTAAFAVTQKYIDGEQDAQRKIVDLV
jgi:integrase/recombinase XerD